MGNNNDVRKFLQGNTRKVIMADDTIIKNFFSKQTIRQLISVALTALVCWETIISNRIDATVLVGIYGTVLGFYFAESE